MTTEIQEIRVEDLDPPAFIAERVEEIRQTVRDGIAICALSGGVDSSVVTMLGHQALGDQLHTFFIDNGLMRENEPQTILETFKNLGINVHLIPADKFFFLALQGITQPEEKREAITKTFYRDVFGPLVKVREAYFLLQGTNFTDIEETVAGIKRQHNVLEQLGIDTKKEFGYQLIEPLVQLRKPAIREVAKALRLPVEIYSRQPFPGPALAARIIGEVTREKVVIIRKATTIVEEELRWVSCFQQLAILHNDKVTGILDGQRQFGYQIEIRSWDSSDGKTATPTQLSWSTLAKIAQRITLEIPEIVSVTYNITPKPPSTIEAV